MSFDSLMRSTCSILVRVAGAVDDTNRPTETWSVAVANHPCRWERNEGVSNNNTYTYSINGKIVVADYIFFMREPTGYVINEEQYRIRFREKVGGGLMDVKLLRVLVRGEYSLDHHLEIPCMIPSGRG